ncbi:hypothetical protein [Pseudomonas vanderleydeniana]|uniref:Uncharacterized protein n=1 Tax=Pseudomonas vanderleydeniana TaxID=2745495 RepID=A0A9E6PGR3_9PSED|nr:hypothetical protein [Pseudomonas vanderleydeniana]QXI26359.1 hypothetical protein HU752_020720 [Pseudomonas vanderleydeniana]
MNLTTRKYLRVLGLVVVVPLVGALLSLLIASLVAIGGVSFMRFAAWQEWQVHNYWSFLAARLILFGLAAWAWVWFRRRTLQVQPATLQRLKRAELTSLAGILLIELMRVLALWEELV